MKYQSRDILITHVYVYINIPDCFYLVCVGNRLRCCPLHPSIWSIEPCFCSLYFYEPYTARHTHSTEWIWKPVSTTEDWTFRTKRHWCVALTKKTLKKKIKIKKKTCCEIEIIVKREKKYTADSNYYNFEDTRETCGCL